MFSRALFVLAPLFAAATATPMMRRAGAPCSWQLIHPYGDSSLCLAVGPAEIPSALQNGQATTLLPCDDVGNVAQPNTYWTQWNIAPGANPSVMVVDSDEYNVKTSGFCLDAGSTPENNGPAKVWECYPGLSQQNWYLTGDNRIAITGGTQCLDRTNGNGQPQTYQCTTGDTNQIWNVSQVVCGPDDEPVPGASA